MRCPASRISPPVMRPGGSSRPITAAPVSDLPAPDSPTTPRISPAPIVERDAVDRLEPAVARVERDFEVAHLEHGGVGHDARLATG